MNQEIEICKQQDEQMLRDNVEKNNLYEEYRLKTRSIDETYANEKYQYDLEVEQLENKLYLQMELDVEIFNLEQ